MPIRILAAAGVVFYAVGGPLLIFALFSGGLSSGGLFSGPLGTVATVGLAAVWLGVGALLVALLQLGRTNHRMLRAQAQRLGAAVAQLDGSEGDATGSTLGERFEALAAAIDARLETDRRETLRVVDARILSIHETVRDLAGSRNPSGATGSTSPADRLA